MRNARSAPALRANAAIRAPDTLPFVATVVYATGLDRRSLANERPGGGGVAEEARVALLSEGRERHEGPHAGRMSLVDHQGRGVAHERAIAWRRVDQTAVA